MFQSENYLSSSFDVSDYSNTSTLAVPLYIGDVLSPCLPTLPLTFFVSLLEVINEVSDSVERLA